MIYEEYRETLDFKEIEGVVFEDLYLEEDTDLKTWDDDFRGHFFIEE